jgi:hypothetical protein
MIEVEALDTLELTKIFPSRCTEFLRILDGLKRNTYFDEETLQGNNNFLNNVLNDSFIPEEISIVGCMTKKNPEWIERRILYKIDKILETSDYLGDALAYLGKRISRLGQGRFGIQDVLVSEPDGYYILIYGIEEI